MEETYYSRQLVLANFGREGQKRLVDSTVLIAGLGGTGCSAAINLALAGVGRLVLIDRDIVGLENLHRQPLYSENDIGKSKAEVAASSLRKMNKIEISYHAMSLDESNADSLLNEVDLAIDCLDNLSSRHALNRACVVKRVTMVHTGALGWEGSVAVFQSPKTACLECLLPPVHDNKLPSCEEIGVLGATTSLVGSLGAIEGIKLLSRGKSSLLGKILVYDLLATEARIIDIAKRGDCGACTVERGVEKSDSLISLCGKGEYYTNIKHDYSTLNKMIDLLSKEANVKKMGKSIVIARFPQGKELVFFRKGGVLIRGVSSIIEAKASLDSVINLQNRKRNS
jgi:adenylyltransferase/sulfurtransferase